MLRREAGFQAGPGETHLEQFSKDARVSLCAQAPFFLRAENEG